MNTFLSEYIFGNNSNSKNDKDISKTLDVDCKIPKHCHSNPLSEYLTETVQIITASRLYNVHVCDLGFKHVLTFMRNMSTREKSYLLEANKPKRLLCCFYFIFQFNKGSAPPASPTTESE